MPLVTSVVCSAGFSGLVVIIGRYRFLSAGDVLLPNNDAGVGGRRARSPHECFIIRHPAQLACLSHITRWSQPNCHYVTSDGQISRARKTNDESIRISEWLRLSMWTLVRRGLRGPWGLDQPSVIEILRNNIQWSRRIYRSGVCVRTKFWTKRLAGADPGIPRGADPIPSLPLYSKFNIFLVGTRTKKYLSECTKTRHFK